MAQNTTPNISFALADGGLDNTDSNAYAVIGVVTNGYAISGNVQLNTSYEINSLGDADDLGIDSAYDANAADATPYPVVVRYHLEEFFRICKKFGVKGKVWLRLTANTVTQAQMADKANTHLKQLLVDAAGEIWLGIVGRNPANNYSSTTVDGMDGDSIAAIAKAEELAIEEAGLQRPLRGIIIEGHHMNTTTAAGSFGDVRANECKYVGICYHNDYDYAQTLGTQGKRHAAWGTLAGLLAARQFNYSAAAVEDKTGSVQDTVAGKYVTIGLSSGQKLSAKSEGFEDTLHTKGYIGLKKYTQFPGVYFTGSPNCNLFTSDYNTIERVSIVSLAQRVMYQALMNKLKAPQLTDVSTGRLSPTTVSLYEGICNDALAFMMVAPAGNPQGVPLVSGIRAVLPPDTDVRTLGKVKVKLTVVDTPGNDGFDVEIGYATTL